jgi:beta-glucanase (GH16 family)
MTTKPPAPLVALLLCLSAGCSSSADASSADASNTGASSADASNTNATSADASASDASSDDAMSTHADGSGATTPTSEVGGASEAGATDAGAAVDASLPGWTLDWSDEFNGADGTPADPSKWSHDVGGGGWGNQEREYYTDGTANAVQRGGNLEITIAKADGSQSCWYGKCLYTSARLLTKGHYQTQYGRVAARMKIPKGQGVWPAFWMLGSNIDAVGWPACGEIDTMENIGKEPGVVHGSLHQTGFNSSGQNMPAAALGDDFHEYAVEWDATAIRFMLDGVVYETKTPASLPSGTTWAFDAPFFLILNVAVGGTWPGDPDGSTVFPQTMLVDWVRVWKKP